MINKKCNCENEVSSRKLAVPLKVALAKKYRRPLKVEALKK